jgi:hypothetical protein
MTEVSKLKIGAIEDDKPVTITIKVPAAVHRDLIAYAEILSRQIGQPVSHRTYDLRGSWRQIVHFRKHESCVRRATDNAQRVA